MLHRGILAGLSTCLLALAFASSQSSTAQAQMVASNGDCWIDEGTGKPVLAGLPRGAHLDDPRDPNHASGNNRGYVRGAGGGWIDEGTGVTHESAPPSGSHL